MAPDSHPGTDDAQRNPSGFSSRAILRMLEETGRAGTWSYDHATGGIDWSEGMYRLVGLAPNSVRPGPDALRHLADPAHRDELDANFMNIATGAIRHFRTRLILPNGLTRWLATHSEIMLTAEGVPARTVGVAVDITEQQVSIEELVRRDTQKARFARELGLFVLAADGELVQLDQPHWQARTGGTPADLASHGWRARIVHADRLAIDAAMDDPAHRTRGFARSFRWRDDHNRLRRGYMALLPPQSSAPSGAAGFVLFFPPETSTAVEPVDVGGRTIRAARALLDWSSERLAEASGVSIATIGRLERDQDGKARDSSYGAILRALEKAGVEFARREDGRITLSLGPPSSR